MALAIRVTRTSVRALPRSSLPSGACRVACPCKTASCLGVSREVAPGSQKQERTLDGTNSQHGRKRRADARRALYVAFRLVSFQAWVFVRASVPPGRRKRVLPRQDATLLDSGPLAISQRW